MRRSAVPASIAPGIDGARLGERRGTDARYWDDFIRFGEIEAMRRALQRTGTTAIPVPR